MAQTVKKNCTMCGKSKNSTRDFYQSYSKLYQANDKRFTVCKDCMISIYDDLVNVFGSEILALHNVCNMFDIYFSERAYHTAKQQAIKQESNIAKIYFQKINSMAQYKDLTSKDSEILDVKHEVARIDNINPKEIESEDLVEFTLTKDIIRRWGRGLDKDDYFILEGHYQELTESYESKTPAQRMIYQEISKSRLEGEKSRRNGDLRGYSDMMKVISTLMTDSNIKPVQKNVQGDDNIDCWGNWCKLIEENEPVGEASEEYKDVDGIQKYIFKWFIKPFARVLGLTGADEEIDVKVKESILQDLEEEV